MMPILRANLSELADTHDVTDLRKGLCRTLAGLFSTHAHNFCKIFLIGENVVDALTDRCCNGKYIFGNLLFEVAVAD